MSMMDERAAMSCSVCGARKDCATLRCVRLPSGADGCGALLGGICDDCWRNNPVAFAGHVMAHDRREHGRG